MSVKIKGLVGYFSKVSHKFNPQSYKLYTHRYGPFSKLLAVRLG